MLKILYSYTDEFNQESTQRSKTITDTVEVTDVMELLVEEFEKFIVGTGFSEKCFVEFMKVRYFQGL